MAKKHKHRKIHWHKEVLLVLLALMSIVLLVYEFTAHPSERTTAYIATTDFVIASIFLVDFWYLFRASKDKRYYLKHNWYLLLSAVPILTEWFSVLRALRLVRFTRLVVAGEHLEQSILQSKHKL